MVRVPPALAVVAHRRHSCAALAVLYTRPDILCRLIVGNLALNESLVKTTEAYPLLLEARTLLTNSCYQRLAGNKRNATLELYLFLVNT